MPKFLNFIKIFEFRAKNFEFRIKIFLFRAKILNFAPKNLNFRAKISIFAPKNNWFSRQEFRKRHSFEAIRQQLELQPANVAAVADEGRV